MVHKWFPALLLISDFYLPVEIYHLTFGDDNLPEIGTRFQAVDANCNVYDSYIDYIDDDGRIYLKLKGE